MPERRIEFVILERLESEQKETNKRIDKVDERLTDLGETIGEIKGALDAPHKSWFMRYVAAPLIVAGILGAITEVAWLHIRLSTLEVQVVGPTTKFKLEQSASAPANPANIRKAEAALDLARKKNVKLPVETVRDTGVKFLEAVQDNPEVWGVAQQFLSYRSFLNVDLSPVVTPATGKSNYRPVVAIHPNPEHPEYHLAYQVMFAGGYATPDKSARLERLDSPQPEGSEFGFFIIKGGRDAVVLDGEYMKNVIIEDADVEYSGGTVVLQNVYFVNCTFRTFKPTPNAVRLGESLLASVPTTFKTDQDRAQGQSNENPAISGG